MGQSQQNSLDSRQNFIWVPLWRRQCLTSLSHARQWLPASKQLIKNLSTRPGFMWGDPEPIGSGKNFPLHPAYTEWNLSTSQGTVSSVGLCLQAESSTSRLRTWQRTVWLPIASPSYLWIGALYSYRLVHIVTYLLNNKAREKYFNGKSK